MAVSGGIGGLAARPLSSAVLLLSCAIALLLGFACGVAWATGATAAGSTSGAIYLAIVAAIALATLVFALLSMKRRLDRARELLRASLDHIHEGVVLTGPDQKTHIYNRRFLELLDLPESLMARRPAPAEVFAFQRDRGEFANIAPETLAAMMAALPVEAPSRYERSRPNGTVIDVRMNKLPHGGAIRSYTDVTALKNAIEEMNASMAFANSLVNSSPDCIQLLDLDGNVSFISDVGQEQFEIEDFETVRGRPFSTFFAEEHHARVELALRRVRDGQTDRFTRMCPTLGGVAKWWDFIITPVHEIGRPPERLFVVARDISARQAHAEELSRAKEAAERASLAKTQFLASMSHEIRTPLNAILGFASLAREQGAHDPTLSRQIELIQKAGESLLTIINDVLDLSKIEAGKIELEQRPLLLRGLVEDCLSLTCGLAQQKCLSLKCEVSPCIPGRILADEARLRQVLLNLLNNAVKFTASGSVVLSVEVTQDLSMMRFAVADTGIGISPDRIAYLFEDFVQGDGSISRQYGGTGLGLSISRRLITLMGGTIDVSSVVGQGSTFHFTLPLVAAGAESEEMTTQASISPRTIAPRSILLVDDLPINLEIVGKMLNSAGHRVSFANSGPSAIAAYSKDRHDLILMDVQMPDMDGLETTRHVRELGGAAAHVPIIALTANVFSQQIEIYRDAGMNDHLGKPFHREALLAMIDHWTGPATGARVQSSIAPVDEPAIIDLACHAELQHLIGSAKVRELLLRFQEELPERFRSAAPEALRADAHAIASTAGLLGFAQLSAAAATLEREIIAGEDISPPLTSVLAARKQAEKQIGTLLQDCGPASADAANLIDERIA